MNNRPANLDRLAYYVLQSHRMTAMQMRVLMALLCRADAASGTCWPSAATIAKDIGSPKNVRAVKQALAELSVSHRVVISGVVKWVDGLGLIAPISGMGGGRGVTVKFQLLTPEIQCANHAPFDEDTVSESHILSDDETVSESDTVSLEKGERFEHKGCVIHSPEPTITHQGTHQGTHQPPPAAEGGASAAEESAEKETDTRTERPPRRKPCATDRVEIPAVLDTPDFRNAWEEWCQHRRESRKKHTPTSQRHQIAKLEQMGEARAVAAINFSIEKGWTGIFEESGTGGGKRGDLAEKNRKQLEESLTALGDDLDENDPSDKKAAAIGALEAECDGRGLDAETVKWAAKNHPAETVRGALRAFDEKKSRERIASPSGLFRTLLNKGFSLPQPRVTRGYDAAVASKPAPKASPADEAAEIAKNLQLKNDYYAKVPELPVKGSTHANGNRYRGKPQHPDSTAVPLVSAPAVPAVA